MYASVNRISIGSDNGLSPIQHQAIILTVIVNWTLRNKLQWNFNQNTKCIQDNPSENIVCEMASILSRGDEFRWRPKQCGCLFLQRTFSNAFYVEPLSIRESICWHVILSLNVVAFYTHWCVALILFNENWYILFRISLNIVNLSAIICHRTKGIMRQ